MIEIGDLVYFRKEGWEVIAVDEDTVTLRLSSRPDQHDWVIEKARIVEKEGEWVIPVHHR